MNRSSNPSSTASPVAKGRAPRSAHTFQGGTSEANRLAVAILEVLAGLRTPADAAAALGISVPRYYQLETRALEGMVTALEPRPPATSPGTDSCRPLVASRADLRIPTHRIPIGPAPASGRDSRRKILFVGRPVV